MMSCPELVKIYISLLSCPLFKRRLNARNHWMHKYSLKWLCWTQGEKISEVAITRPPLLPPLHSRLNYLRCDLSFLLRYSFLYQWPSLPLLPLHLRYLCFLNGLLGFYAWNCVSFHCIFLSWLLSAWCDISIRERTFRRIVRLNTTSRNFQKFF